LLSLMGYDQAPVRAVYGPSLVDRSADALTFNTLFNARLGREPEWKRIEIAKVTAPPSSDRGP
jgi:lipid A ethanolaminephosphotransferase